MNKNLFITLSLCFIFLHCARLKYRPPAPENLRVTADERQALQDIEKVAEMTVSRFSRKDVMAAYLTVTKSNGIDQHEALTLARSEIYFRGEEDLFHIEDAVIRQVQKEAFHIRVPARQPPLTAQKTPDRHITVDRATGMVTLFENRH